MTPDLIERIQRDPCVLDAISPRDFEELVAELLASFGWEISLTRHSRDGSHDILGISRDASGLETTWVVDCKRYNRTRRVGLEIVARLLGIKTAFGLPQALLVTSSFLTKNAQRYLDATNGLQVADRDTLLSWIASYTRERQAYLPRQRFLSCFVSYSHKDEEFVKRLVARLRVAGVRVWFAPEDLAGGKKLYEEISSAIDRFDRLLVVLSQNSMQSEWVKTEIRNARKREVKNGGRVLFPIALVSYKAIQDWELFDADLGHDLARELREYYIPDFSNWHIPATFEEHFAKVIAGLNTA